MTKGTADKHAEGIAAQTSHGGRPAPPGEHAAVPARGAGFDVLAELDFGMLAHLEAPAIVVGCDGRIAFANAATETLFHARPGALLQDLVAAGRSEALLAELDWVCETRSPGRLAGFLTVLPLMQRDICVGVLLVADPAASAPPASGRTALTPRQSEVLGLLAQGLGTSAIADRLGLATDTVRNHVRAILGALGARSRLEAVVTAERLGLVRTGNRS